MSFANYSVRGFNNGVSVTSSKVDGSIMNSGTPTGLNGISMLFSSVQNGTPEVKSLLSSECDIILECNICRNLFRNVPNFITHKRSYCRASAGELFRQRFLALNEDANAAQGQIAVSNRSNQPQRLLSVESCPSFPVQDDDARNNSASLGPGDSTRSSSRDQPNTVDNSALSFLNRLAKQLDSCVTEASRNDNRSDTLGFARTRSRRNHVEDDCGGVKEAENEDHQQSRPLVAPAGTLTTGSRAMRKRTLKSPYDAAEYVNSWPSRRSRTAAPKTNTPDELPVQTQNAENIEAAVEKKLQLSSLISNHEAPAEGQQVGEPCDDTKDPCGEVVHSVQNMAALTRRSKATMNGNRLASSPGYNISVMAENA